MKNKVIGIEGLVGAGKTSICKALLDKVPNSILLQGGNLYRAIVFALMNSETNRQELKQNMEKADIKQIMEKFKVSLQVENRDTVIYIDGKKVKEEDLQSAISSLAVSEVSNVADNKNFYLFGKGIIEKFKQNYNVIVSGRDLMKIYPELDYHFLITASLEERVKRKCIQYNGKISKQEVEKNILKRDELQEKSGFYEKYDNTILVDVTKCKTIEEATNKVFNYITK